MGSKFMLDDIMTLEKLKRELKRRDDCFRNIRMWNYDGLRPDRRYKRVECNYCAYDVIYKFEEESYDEEDGRHYSFVFMDLWFESEYMMKTRHERAHYFCNDAKDYMDNLKLYNIVHWMYAILLDDIRRIKLLDKRNEEILSIDEVSDTTTRVTRTYQRWDPFGRNIFHKELNNTWKYA